MTTLSDQLTRKLAYKAIGNLRQQMQDLLNNTSVAASGREALSEIATAMGYLLEAQRATGAHVTEAEYEAAALSLHRAVFGEVSTDGTVGHGDGCLHVYVYKRSFGRYKDTIANWNGIPVIWHLKVGRPKAASRRGWSLV